MRKSYYMHFDIDSPSTEGGVNPLLTPPVTPPTPSVTPPLVVPIVEAKKNEYGDWNWEELQTAFQASVYAGKKGWGRLSQRYAREGERTTQMAQDLAAWVNS